MSKFKIEDYETVDSRIKQFYKDHESGCIRTEIEKISDDFSTVVVKAFLFNNDTMLSTGYAMEIKGQGFVNKDAWLENCETSAIGRALANHGYSGDKRPSREEMSKTQIMSEEKKLEIYAKIKETIESAKNESELKLSGNLIRDHKDVFTQTELNGLIGIGKQKAQELNNE